MTAPALILPEPIGLQQGWLDNPKPRKILRIGRRGGKTRVALVAGIAGHGPGDDGHKALPGILQGVDVVWIAQDYPNLLRVVWKEEVRPRLGHLPYCKLNEQAHTATITGLGTLHFVSAEAIDGIRGLGSRVGGVIVDEAAWLDLERGLLDVILPILLDNGGWLMLLSTTNAGPDGNSAKRLPSYFNLLAEQTRAGERSDDWVEFYGTAFDNPVISDAAINELIAEYPEGSPKLKQEVYAELLQAGEGLALPILHKDVHLVEAFVPPLHWPRFGSFDWGFNHPWVFIDYVGDDDGNVIAVDTIWGREQQPEQIAETVHRHVPVDRLRGVWSGTDIFDKKGTAIGYKGPTIAEKMLLAKIPLVKAKTDRVMGLDNLRAYVAYTVDEAGRVTKPPRFTLMKTDGNLRLFAQLSQMQIDPKNLEDALKIDADASGKGGDDGYDSCRYGLMSRPIAARRAPSADVTEQDRSPGYDFKAQKPRVRQSAESEAHLIFERAKPNLLANRFRMPRR